MRIAVKHNAKFGTAPSLVKRLMDEAEPIWNAREALEIAKEENRKAEARYRAAAAELSAATKHWEKARLQVTQRRRVVAVREQKRHDELQRLAAEVSGNGTV